MSLLGFDALGRFALGQFHGSAATTTILTAAAGSYALTGTAAPFKVSEAAAAGSYSLAGVSTAFKVTLAPAVASYALTGVSVTFTIREAAAAGSYILTGYAANELTTEIAEAGSYKLTLTPTQLYRTGADFDLVYGGVGHYLVELENARQLARITRKTPAPIDRTSAPSFKPVGSPPMAPPAPVIDLQAAQNQRADAQAAAAAQAATIKRRREEEELLLLAC